VLFIYQLLSLAMVIVSASNGRHDIAAVYWCCSTYLAVSIIHRRATP
jgi:hypothetical protein